MFLSILVSSTHLIFLYLVVPGVEVVRPLLTFLSPKTPISKILKVLQSVITNRQYSLITYDNLITHHLW